MTAAAIRAEHSGEPASRRPLVLTMGEPAGIGGEITLRAWLTRDPAIPAFVAIDNYERLMRLADELAVDVPLRVVETTAEAAEVFGRALPVLDIPLAVAPVPGRPTSENAVAVVHAIDRAVALVRTGEAAAVVTNPIHKNALYEAGFKHPGHTEYLADLNGSGNTPEMMLVCDQLRTVPVSIHVSLRDALDQLTTGRIVDCGTVVARALSEDFGIAAPRLAVAGLNPHAGEQRAMGNEDADIVAPAVARLREAGIAVSGPHPPDTLFSAANRETYDAALCMYHDQALIPIKTLDFEGGVNVTLGLDFVRTSPDHGTALDIAGTGRASERSLMEALRLAGEISDRRLALGR